ncbi:hypothetical protein VINE108274_12335 [Vibrio neptunius]
MDFSSEENFKSFMTQYEAVEDLDEMEEKFPDGTRIADYSIRDVTVIELKTLKEDPTQRMANFFHEVMKRPDFPAIYGKLNFRRVVSLLPDGDIVIQKFEQKAFRQIETILRSANKQIISTIDTLKMDSRTTGTLIIINEFAEFFEPNVLVGYIADMLCAQNPQNELRFANIHNVILIQDTHKLKDSNQAGIAIPIYHVVNDKVAATEITDIADQALGNLIESYSYFNKCKYKVCNNTDESLYIEKFKQPKTTEPLRGQEWIEEEYRKNRYMKDFTDEELIEFGSMVMSVCLAIVLKERPLVTDKHHKMMVFRTKIELFEESRLRPFDLGRLDVDPRRYTP